MLNPWSPNPLIMDYESFWGSWMNEWMNEWVSNEWMNGALVGAGHKIQIIQQSNYPTATIGPWGMDDRWIGNTFSLGSST